MLMVLSHFEEGETNLQRHPQLLDLVRQNRWLEELTIEMVSYSGANFDETFLHLRRLEKQWKTPQFLL